MTVRNNCCPEVGGGEGGKDRPSRLRISVCLLQGCLPRNITLSNASCLHTAPSFLSYLMQSGKAWQSLFRTTSVLKSTATAPNHTLSAYHGWEHGGHGDI